MSRLTYAVIRDGDCWRILSGRSRMGHFPTWRDAAEATVNLAREAARADHAVEVLIQDRAGELWPVAQFDPAAHAGPDA